MKDQLQEAAENAKKVHKNWKPSDGDKKCQSCGRKNPTWFAENKLFNLVNGGEAGVICPLCFEKMADKKGINIIFKAEQL